MSSNNGQKEIPKLNKHASLNLSSKNVGDEHIGRFLSQMEQMNNLTKLDLGCNSISDKGASTLAEFLKKNSSIAYVDLGRNKISNKGAVSLAESLKFNKVLEQIHLFNNEIGDEGASAFAEALNYNTSLRVLDLFSNKVGDNGVIDLAEMLKLNNSLVQLNLYCNSFGNKGATALHEALLENKTLCKLEIGLNSLDPELEMKILKLVQTNIQQQAKTQQKVPLRSTSISNISEAQDQINQLKQTLDEERSKWKLEREKKEIQLEKERERHEVEKKEWAEEKLKLQEEIENLKKIQVSLLQQQATTTNISKDVSSSEGTIKIEPPSIPKQPTIIISDYSTPKVSKVSPSNEKTKLEEKPSRTSNISSNQIETTLVSEEEDKFEEIDLNLDVGKSTDSQQPHSVKQPNNVTEEFLKLEDEIQELKQQLTQRPPPASKKLSLERKQTESLILKEKEATEFLKQKLFYYMCVATKLNLQLFEGRAWNGSIHELFEEASNIPPEEWESWLNKYIKRELK